jgi:hypothetical protein
MFTGLDGPIYLRNKKFWFWSASNFFRTRTKRENPMKKALRNHKQKYWERMRDQDRELF